jgi:hypothetical protein
MVRQAPSRPVNTSPFQPIPLILSFLCLAHTYLARQASQKTWPHMSTTGWRGGASGRGGADGASPASPFWDLLLLRDPPGPLPAPGLAPLLLLLLGPIKGSCSSGSVLEVDERSPCTQPYGNSCSQG